jgi:16S rRNA (guanine966-N2)-methyltransferase
LIRIVGGACKKRPIRVPKGGVRPTKGIVRGAIFNIIGDNITDAEVLDIFAGSGALGLEALSRGARHCTFIEKRPTTLRTNITALSFRKQTTILAHDFQRALRQLKKRAFDLIFADPPYNKNLAQKVSDLVKRHGLLTNNGMLIIEHSPREKISASETLSVLKQRKYGDTMITIIKNTENTEKTQRTLK